MEKPSVKSSKTDYLQQAFAEGLLQTIQSGKTEKIRYVAVNHAEKWSDPEEQVRAAYYAGLVYRYAYREFAERVGEVKAPRGAKGELVRAAIEQQFGEFTIREIEQTCPGVSRDMVRRVLREQQTAGSLDCSGRGPAARWRKKG